MLVPDRPGLGLTLSERAGPGGSTTSSSRPVAGRLCPVPPDPVPPNRKLDRDTGRGLAYELVERLKARILAGEIAPGQRLPTESSLIQEFGVSRTVVREAVSRLQAAGLVETFQGRGSFVLALPPSTAFSVEAAQVRTHRDVLDMIDFRIGVESEAAGLAAERRTEPQLKAVERALVDLGAPAFAGCPRTPSRPTSSSTSRSRWRRGTGSTRTCWRRWGR
ncbi:FadR/GntR family transcriptional regulator [Nonomuraea antimicrobica]